MWRGQVHKRLNYSNKNKRLFYEKYEKFYTWIHLNRANAGALSSAYNVPKIEYNWKKKSEY